MLAFLFTDAVVPADRLQACLARAVQKSFNRAIVDGDTSTNDTVLAFASGESGGAPLSGPGLERFSEALETVAVELAQAIVRDGEGATKFVTIQVMEAASEKEAETIAACVAKSPLVKTAFAGSDPNWGRILAAVGYAGVPLEVDRISILLDAVPIVTNGVRDPDYREEMGQRVMAQKEITITIRLGLGEATTTHWTCDLTHGYIEINADYRT